MPTRNFNNDTFVAFLDISGFKHLMKDEIKAWKAIDRLYQYGYDVIQESNGQVEGLFVSDSGILFLRDCQNKVKGLKNLLKVIKDMNEQMLKNDFMLTTSIAYGHFRYEKRIEFEGIEKNPIYCNAYISAFLDNENGTPKIQPGQCRIVKENLPENIVENLNGQQNDEIFRMIRKRDGDKKHYYYYWMRDDSDEINSFEQEYKDAFNLKYAGILKALKGNKQ